MAKSGRNTVKDRSEANRLRLETDHARAVTGVLREQRKIKRAELIAEAIKKAPTVINTFVIMFFAWKIAEAFAGKVTLADIDVLLDLGIVDWLPYLFHALLLAWAITERLVRLRANRRLGEMTAGREREKDPNRSSSGILPSGATNPAD